MEDTRRKTAKEVSKIVGLSCRQIQELETRSANQKKSLAQKPNKKNKYGHLLYGEEEIKRLWELRFFKELGYEKPQIEEFEAKHSREEAFGAVIKELEEKRDKIDNLIAVAEMMKDTGRKTGDFKFGVKLFEDVSYDNLSTILGIQHKFMKNIYDREESYQMEVFEELMETAEDILEEIMYLQSKKEEYSSNVVQEVIAKLYEAVAKQVSGSVSLISASLISFETDEEICGDIDEEYGRGSAMYFFKSFHHYCDNITQCEAEDNLGDAIQKIIDLGKDKVPANAQEVQNEVSRWYKYYDDMYIFTVETRKELLKKQGEAFASHAYMKMIDGGNVRGFSWFISRAIQIFYENMEKE